MSEERFAERRRDERRRRFRRVLLGLLTVIVVGTVVWVFWFSSALAVNRIQVQGLTTLKPMDVRSQAAIRLGEPLARVDTAAIESRVAEMERVDQVDVSRSWPRTIRIDIVERKPIAWVLSAGSIRALDRYGVDFRTLNARPKDLVEVRIETSSARRRQQALEGSAAVVEVLRTDGADLLRKVRSVRAGSKDSITLTLGKNRTVTWGSAAKGDQKIRVLRSLLKIKARSYDVSAPEQPTTRR